MFRLITALRHGVASMKSKNNFLPSFNYALLLVVLLTACGQPPEPIVADLIIPAVVDESEPAHRIKQIEEEFDYVEKLLSEAMLSVDSLEYECENDPKGGTISFYRSGEELRLIQSAYYEGDHASVMEKYYLKNGELFFAFVEEVVWTFDGDLPKKRQF